MKKVKTIVAMSLALALYAEASVAGIVCNRIRRAVENAYIIDVDRKGVDIYLDGRRRWFSHDDVQDKLDEIRSRVRGCDRDTKDMVYDLINEYYSYL